MRQQIQHHSTFASALESLTEFSKRHQKVTNRAKKDKKCMKDKESTLEVACLEESTLTSVSKASLLSPENSREEAAEVCVQEPQCPKMAARTPSVLGHAISSRKKSMLNAALFQLHYIIGMIMTSVQINWFISGSVHKNNTVCLNGDRLLLGYQSVFSGFPLAFPLN